MNESGTPWSRYETALTVAAIGCALIVGGIVAGLCVFVPGRRRP